MQAVCSLLLSTDTNYSFAWEKVVMFKLGETIVLESNRGSTFYTLFGPLGIIFEGVGGGDFESSMSFHIVTEGYDF